MINRTAFVFVLLPWLFLVALPATVVWGKLAPPLVIGVGSFEGEERAHAEAASHHVRRHYVSGSGFGP